MLLAEDLLLLLTDDTSGTLAKSASLVDTALAGAMLIELAMRAKVDLTGGDDPGRIVVRDPSPTGDDLLDAALRTLGDHEGATPKNVLRALGKGLRARLFDRLVDRGVVRRAGGRILGRFPVRSWPTEDAGHESALLTRLRSVLVDGEEPDDRVGALVALLHAVRALPTVLDARASGLSRRDLQRRAAEVAAGNWGSNAVRQAIDEMAAALTAVVVAVTAGASG